MKTGELRKRGRGLRSVVPAAIRQPIMALGLTTVLLAFFCLPTLAVGPYSAGGRTVLDQGTGLEWQKGDDATTRTWQDALAYCEGLVLDGKTDWRLPNIRELKSLVVDVRYYPAIAPAFTAQSAPYWSATSVVDHPAPCAWVVNFSNGDDNWYVKTGKYHARCVRAGIPSP